VAFMDDSWQFFPPGIVVLQFVAFMIHFLRPKKLLDSFYEFVAFLMAVFIIILIKDYSSCDICILIKIQKERKINPFFTSYCKKWWKTLPPSPKTFEYTVRALAWNLHPHPACWLRFFIVSWLKKKNLENIKFMITNLPAYLPQ
jgi:hypothetical protein